MAEPARLEICQRIAQLRLETAGPRGKSAFAKRLALSPSTYDYYEHSRVPPAEVLVRIAEVTGVDLRWLLTGRAAEPDAVGADSPVLRRAVALLANCPDAAGPLVAFLDILAEAAKFPPKAAPGATPLPDAAARAEREAHGLGREGPATGTGSASLPPRRAVDRPADAGAPPGGSTPIDRDAARAGWIPILGRSAAGVPRFWGEGDEMEGLTTLEALVARHAAAAPRSVRTASATVNGGGEESPVQIVTLSAPDEHDVVEFVSAPQIKARCPGAFALRIDGDSMAPDIRHGDLVILSPRVPAAEGRPAVVQLEGQIGVTCKLFRRLQDAVHLVPISDRHEIAAFPADQVAWALRVVARVRC